MSLEQLFLDNLRIVERLVFVIARRYRFTREESEDLDSFVKLKLIDDNYRILRGYSGKSTIDSYLVVAVQHLALDYVAHHYGKWRPSATARRLGHTAVQLETLISRDGYSVSEAAAVLATDFKVPGSRQDLEALAARLPQRTRSRAVGLDQIEQATAGESADRVLLDHEHAARARALERSLAKAILELRGEDREVLRMIYQDGLTLKRVAERVGVKLRALYLRVHDLLWALRSSIKSDGFRDEDVVDLLTSWGNSGVQPELSPWALFQDAEPSARVVSVVQSITADLITQLKLHPEHLHALGSRQFEELVAEILAGYGWRVDLTRATRDGGYDIFAISTDATGLRTSWLVECKRYSRLRKVGVDVIRALYGTRDLVIPGGMLLVATTSHFSKDAHAVKNSRYDLELKDYDALLDWIQDYRPNPGGRLYTKDHGIERPPPTTMKRRPNN